MHEDLIEREMGQAKAMAINFHRRYLRPDRDECIATAYLGLVKAAIAFDPARNDNFHIYAITYIRGALFDMVRKELTRAKLAPEFVSLTEWNGVIGSHENAVIARVIIRNAIGKLSRQSENRKDGTPGRTKQVALMLADGADRVTIREGTGLSEGAADSIIEFAKKALRERLMRRYKQ